MQIGVVGSLLYSTSLSVYHVAAVKFSMKEEVFKKKIEFWCHLIPNGYALGTAIFLQHGKFFNSIGE